ncbi:MAG: SAM-dependent methyltransferase [Gammaproteobacteria bacterium]|nr:MAG: SAM-dependent methyltransferase [Gammaproteobacteria bacterium]
MHAAELPPPPPALQAVSEALRERIAARIRTAGGWLDFADYMQAALYEPGLGYYSGGARKFGEAGDFVTAPEISPLFARCLAEAVGPVLAALGGGSLLEIGPGSGALAAELLPALAARDRLPDRYLLLEVSAELRERQQQRLAQLPAGLAGRCQWLDALPAAPFRGVILGNEVLDALPVSRFCWRDGRCQALGVTLAGDGFAWAEAPASETLSAAVAARLGPLRQALPDGYRSEICLQLEPWLASIAARLSAGMLLFADYGLVRREYYHPQRRDGSLICHYRHRAHADPFWLPGGQDISAWVDFTAVAEAGIAAGLALAGFSNQAGFLLAHGLEAEAARLEAGAPTPGGVSGAAALRRLLLPGEMGEYFKFIALGRGLPPGLVDWPQDQSARL